MYHVYFTQGSKKTDAGEKEMRIKAQPSRTQSSRITRIYPCLVKCISGIFQPNYSFIFGYLIHIAKDLNIRYNISVLTGRANLPTGWILPSNDLLLPLSNKLNTEYGKNLQNCREEK